MTIFLIILWLMLLISLFAITAIVPNHSRISDFELNRRAKAGDHVAIKKLRRKELLGVVEALQNIKISVLLVLIAAISIALFGWLYGVVASIIISFLYEPVLAAVKMINKPFQGIYEKYEPKLLDLIEKHRRLFSLFGTKQHKVIANLHSREELKHVISRTHFLSEDDKKTLQANINFSALMVSDIMTPREEVVAVKKTEMLGPLVLDQLHKTNHNIFPVTDGGLDKIVGILNIKDMVSLKERQSHMAKTVMSSEVHKVLNHKSAYEVLSSFLHHQSHLFIVVNDNNKTVGVVTLSDVLKMLIGRSVKSFEEDR